MAEIIEVFAREILDARGVPTIEVEVGLADGVSACASVPTGASVGIHEAAESRDKDLHRYGGKGVQKAVSAIEEIIAPEITGIYAKDQDLVDKVMCHIDDTENKAMIGANAILAVSLATAKAAAKSMQQPLFRYLGGIQANSLPVPLCAIIAGGSHVDNDLDFEEFSIAPVGLPSFREGIRAVAEITHAMRAILHEKGLSTAIADEGAFAPAISHSTEALDLIMYAIAKAGYVPGQDIYIGVDCAASEVFCPNDKIYELRGEGANLSTQALKEYYLKTLRNYPIIAVEDPFEQNDWAAWQEFMKLDLSFHILGDDIFSTTPARIRKGIALHAADGTTIKPNQIGTLTETLDAVRTAQRGGMMAVVSHRTGETEDTFIADLAVATNCHLFKAGGLARAERVVKYNRLMRIEEVLGEDAAYIGKFALKPHS